MRWSAKMRQLWWNIQRDRAHRLRRELSPPHARKLADKRRRDKDT